MGGGLRAVRRSCGNANVTMQRYFHNDRDVESGPGIDGHARRPDTGTDRTTGTGPAGRDAADIRHAGRDSDGAQRAADDHNRARAVSHDGAIGMADCRRL